MRRSLTKGLSTRLSKSYSQRRGHTAHRTGHQYIFSGLLRCGDCGGLMGGGIATSGVTRETKARRTYHVYRCQKFHIHGRSACHCNGISEAPLLDAVVRLLERHCLETRRSTGSSSSIESGWRHGGEIVPADDGRLRRQIDNLDRQIDQGADRVLSAPENLVGTIYAKIGKTPAGAGPAARLNLTQQGSRRQAPPQRTTKRSRRRHGSSETYGRRSRTPIRRIAGNCSLRSSRRSSYTTPISASERKSETYSSTGRFSSVLPIRH